MTPFAVETLVAQLFAAGLKLSQAPAGGLAVAPSSRLTADLRDLIRTSKALLIDWLNAASSVGDHAPDRTANPMNWKALAADYHAHHFTCAACIAAGRRTDQGSHCPEGAVLWNAYQATSTSPAIESDATIEEVNV